MSTAGEEHSDKRGNIEGRATGQQRQSVPPRDSGTQNRKGGKGGGGGGTNIQNLNGKTPESPSTPNPPPQEEHVPLAGFNSMEVDDMLRKGFDAKAPVYKPETQPPKSGSVWGAKAGAMVNGKDFWLELRKQVTALQRSGGISQGG